LYQLGPGVRYTQERFSSELLLNLGLTVKLCSGYKEAARHICCLSRRERPGQREDTKHATSGCSGGNLSLQPRHGASALRGKDSNCLRGDSDLLICFSLPASHQPVSTLYKTPDQFSYSTCISSQSCSSVLATFDRCSLMLVYSLFAALSLSEQPQGLNTEAPLCSSLVK